MSADRGAPARRPWRLSLMIILTALTAACSGAAQGAGGAGFVSGNGATGVIPAAERTGAPEVEGTTLDGEQIALRDLRGPVVINFWASWCGPCVKEAPALRNVAAAYKGRVSFIGVNVKDETAAAQNFEQDFKVPYPSWEDPAAAIAASFGGIGPSALPSTLVLDAEYRVAVRLFGSVDEPQLSSHLDTVLDQARD